VVLWEKIGDRSGVAKILLARPHLSFLILQASAFLPASGPGGSSHCRSDTVITDANTEILHRPDGHRRAAFREPRSESFREPRLQADHDQVWGAFSARPSDLR